jgi:hypothetical protein
MRSRFSRLAPFRRRAALSAVVLAAATTTSACSGWSEVRHTVAPSADFDYVARNPAPATYEIRRSADLPVCYEVSGAILRSPTCVDGLRSHIEDGLDVVLGDFLTQSSGDAPPDYVVSFELSSIHRGVALRGVAPSFTAEWRISIVDRAGKTVIRASRTHRGAPGRDVDDGLRELQKSVAHEVRALVGESVIATQGAGS